MRFDDKLDTVLIVDDEPFQTDWLTDYFVARNLQVRHCANLQEALTELQRTRFKYVIIDLSIPFSPELAQPLATLGAEFFRFPGLMIARRARTIAHNTYQIVVYSVHDSAEVQVYAEKDSMPVHFERSTG